MSDSTLVSYTLISANCNHPRNHKIDTITIHHMAGNLSVETCGKIFQNPKRQASSNYGIGTDGRIGLYVHEVDRAWTSGSPANDHRAITIEVANDGGADTNWHVSDTALKSLINLLTDICIRNGIKKLVWSDNKDNRVNHKNGCNMTVHRDFQATACPGPYLYSKQAWIAQQVNKNLEKEKDMTKAETEALINEMVPKIVKQLEAEKALQPADPWAEDIIEEVKETGLMTGDPDGNFRPQSYVKREELAAVAVAVDDKIQAVDDKTEYIDAKSSASDEVIKIIVDKLSELV